MTLRVSEGLSATDGSADADHTQHTLPHLYHPLSPTLQQTQSRCGPAIEIDDLPYTTGIAVEDQMLSLMQATG
jgi:hypothetical protein